MAKLLSFLVLFLMVTLLIPTGLVLTSQDSVPGESMYPVKRTLEQGILTMASLHPWTKAYFQSSRSNNRFNEVRTLLSRNENAGDSLVELATQANDAALAINNVSVADRKRMRERFLKQLDSYNQALVAYQAKNGGPALAASPAPTPTSQPTNAVDLARERAAQQNNQPAAGQGRPQVVPIQPQAGQPQAQAPAAAAPAAQPVSQLAPTPVQPVTDPAAIQRAIAEIERVRRLMAEQAAREEEERQRHEQNEVPPQVAVVTNPQTPNPPKDVDTAPQAAARSGPPASNLAPTSAPVAIDPSPSPSLSPGRRNVAEVTETPQNSQSVSIIEGSCSNNVANLLWNIGTYIDKTVINFTVRINHYPAEEWAPGEAGKGDMVVQTGFPIVNSSNVMRIEVPITPGSQNPGRIEGWSVQPGFRDATGREFAGEETFHSSSGFTCN